VLVLLLGSSLRVGAQAQDPHYPVAGSRVRMASRHVGSPVVGARAGARLRRHECQRASRTPAARMSLRRRRPAGQRGPLFDLVLSATGRHPAARRAGGNTSPGSRVVWICGRVPKTSSADSVMGEALLIHEVLHSLGLREGPPSPQEITARVLERCQ
jgi:hypothetical protein